MTLSGKLELEFRGIDCEFGDSARLLPLLLNGVTTSGGYFRCSVNTWNWRKKTRKSVLGHLLAINAKNCLYLYCFLMQRIYLFTRPNDFCLSAQAWLQVVHEQQAKLNKYTKKRKKPVEPNYSNKVVHLAWWTTCLRHALFY